jgi:hypothetical protein
MKRKSLIRFADPNLKKAFEELKHSTIENKRLFNFINRAFDDLEENAFCGVQIPKRQIPREYIKKYAVDNCWKYNLPGAWRLIYSVVDAGEIILISLVLEWFNHKEYEKRFKY